MSLLYNHSLIQRPTFVVHEVVAMNILNGVASPATITFSRAPRSGEIIILGMATNFGNVPGTPSGFTSQSFISTPSRLVYKVAGVSEPSSYAFPYTGVNDTKEAYGMIISGFNATNIFAANQSWSAPSGASPQNLLASSVFVEGRSLVIALVGFSAGSPQILTMTNGFLWKQHTLAGARSFISWGISTQSGNLNPTYTWPPPATTTRITNWIQLNP